MSLRGMCPPCAKWRMFANDDQIRARSGPFFERWARRSLMAAQRALVAADKQQA